MFHFLTIKKNIYFASRNKQVTLRIQTYINTGNPYVKPVFLKKLSMLYECVVIYKCYSTVNVKG